MPLSTADTNPLRRATCPLALSAFLLLAAAYPPLEDGSPDLAAKAELQRVSMAGRSLTKEQAEALEAALEANPDNVLDRVKLLAYYMGRVRSAEARKAHARHAL